MQVSEEAVEVFTERVDLGQVTQLLRDNGFSPNQSELTMEPNTTLELAPEEATAVLTLIEGVEELDDVTKVYHNLELTEAVMAQFA